MWGKAEFTEKLINKDTGKYEKTGRKEERTTYTFKDEFGEKLVLLAGNDYRELEGRQCNITLSVKYNDFDRATRVSLATVVPAD